MNQVVLGLGSNINREENIRSGVDILTSVLSEIDLSPVYEARSVGFYGENFLNLVVSGKTELSLSAFAKLLRDIEYDHGREKNALKYSPRTLDIDILTFEGSVGKHAGILLPRDEIIEQAYVLKPLADLIPDDTHPTLGRTYLELWHAFQKDVSGLWLSDFQLERNSTRKRS